jgi:hypothetical protein
MSWLDEAGFEAAGRRIDGRKREAITRMLGVGYAGSIM